MSKIRSANTVNSTQRYLTKLTSGGLRLSRYFTHRLPDYHLQYFRTSNHASNSQCKFMPSYQLNFQIHIHATNIQNEISKGKTNWVTGIVISSRFTVRSSVSYVWFNLLFSAITAWRYSVAQQRTCELICASL